MIKYLFIPAVFFLTIFTFPAKAQELLKVSCSDEEKTVSENRVSIRTCSYGDLTSIRTGVRASSGHFRYTYKLLQKKNNVDVSIPVTDLLRNEDKLLEAINQKISVDYTELLEDPVSGPCLKNQNETPVFGWKELGFTFDEFGYHFHANFSVQEKCADLEHTTVSFTPAKMKRFLKN